MAPVFHRLVPTPPRAVYWLVLSAVALPFFAAYHALVRTRSEWWGVALGALGRVVLLVVLLLGLALGALPSVIALVLPLLVLQYVLLELFAAPCWAGSRNTTVLAVVDAVILGWMAAVLSPVS